MAIELIRAAASFDASLMLLLLILSLSAGRKPQAGELARDFTTSS
jgi:hypothetical protein